MTTGGHSWLERSQTGGYLVCPEARALARTLRALDCRYLQTKRTGARQVTKTQKRGGVLGALRASKADRILVPVNAW